MLLASLLIGQVGSGLVDAKVRSVTSEAESGLRQAQSAVEEALQARPGSEATVVLDVLPQVTQTLSDRGAADDLYRVVLLGPDGATSFASPGADPAELPAELLAALADGGSGVAADGAGRDPVYVFDQVPSDGGRRRGIVVGGVLSAGPSLPSYRLFHLFPLTAEEETLGLVRRNTAVAGLLLVGLLALIAGLITRQVVVPVRQAAEIAERLAAGRLDERMKVHGDDEIARLGSTFNGMAGALQRQIGQLEELSRLQRRFVSDVSHELRTPLTTVRMAADVLHDARADFDPGAARSSELLQLELDRFERLLVDLLEISRYDAGAASLAHDQADLLGVVRRAVAQVQPLADKSGTLLDVSRVPAGPVTADLDEVRIERVLRNLLVNALEHGEGRPVEVEVGADEHAVAVAVRDHGVGLKPGEQNLVFTRFWRGDPSRARTTGGTGLGLAISFEDVRLHGGWLHADGRPGEGATFRMTLPRRVGAALAGSPLPMVRP